EDQSRMLILNIDYDRDVIRQSLLNSAAGKTRSEVKIDMEPWYKLQEEIAFGPKEVVIPFAQDPAQLMPIENIKVQRDFPKVLRMIESCALVHHQYRKKNTYGDVIATRDDFEVIHRLLAIPLSQGLE